MEGSSRPPLTTLNNINIDDPNSSVFKRLTSPTKIKQQLRPGPVSHLAKPAMRLSPMRGSSIAEVLQATPKRLSSPKFLQSSSFSVDRPDFASKPGFALQTAQRAAMTSPSRVRGQEARSLQQDFLSKMESEVGHKSIMKRQRDEEFVVPDKRAKKVSFAKESEEESTRSLLLKVLEGQQRLEAKLDLLRRQLDEK